MAESTSAAPRCKSNRVWRWTKRFTLVCVGLGLLYAAAAFALSRIPVNRNFVPADEGVEIAVLSNGVHVDIALPLENMHYDWMKHLRKEDFARFDPGVQFVAFGWGERTFYLETPTWADVNPILVMRAFCGMGRSVMHVELLGQAPSPSKSCRRFKISPDQYHLLCQQIMKTMKTDSQGKLSPIAGAHYHDYDAFYEAAGHYHVFHTCNAWAGDVLRASGIRVGLWTPTTGGVFACLPGE